MGPLMRGEYAQCSKNSLNIVVHNTVRDKEGRYVILYCTFKGFKMVLANIYAPNRDNPQFLQKVFEQINKFSPQLQFVAGDMNLALDKVLDHQESVTSNDKSADWLAKYIDTVKLVDIFRFTHPDSNGFTYYSKYPKLNFSRLDYIFISEEILQFVDVVRVLPSFKSDHSLVELIIQFKPFKRGPGYWKINNALLRDADYVDKMNHLIKIALEEQVGSFKQQWELLMLSARGSTIQYASRRCKSDRLKDTLLERRLTKLHDELKDQNPLKFMDTEEQITLFLKTVIIKKIVTLAFLFS